MNKFKGAAIWPLVREFCIHILLSKNEHAGYIFSIKAEIMKYV